MTRMLLLATFSLAATTLSLPAQTPNGPVQGAVQGTVKGTATVGQGVVQGAGQAGQGIVQGSASRRVLDRPRSALQGALARLPPKPAEVLGAS